MRVSCSRLTLLLPLVLFACGPEKRTEGLRVGDETADIGIFGADFEDRFPLLVGGTMRLTALEHGVAGDARIVRAWIDDERVAELDVSRLPGPGVRVHAHQVGSTPVHVTTETGRTFDAVVQVEEAGPSEAFVATRAPSACDLLPETWFDLRPVIPEDGVVYDVGASTFEPPPALAAVTRTASGARRAGWGGVTFTSSADDFSLQAHAPDAFHFGFETIEFVDTRDLPPTRHRGPVTLSIGGSSVVVDVAEHVRIHHLRAYPATGGFRDVAHPNTNLDGTSVRISKEFLGAPRECADVLVIPFDERNRPILGLQGQARVTAGDEHLALRGVRANVVGMVGRSIGSAAVRVTYADQNVDLHVDVVPSQR